MKTQERTGGDAPTPGLPDQSPPFLVDLHVHCRERSGCSQRTQEEQIREAIEAGLGAIALTDHNNMITAPDIARLRQQFAPFPIYQGVERNVADEEFVVLGVEDPDISTVAPADYPAFHAFVRARGGFLFIAHPFRYHDSVKTDLLNYPVDAVEGYSSNLAREKWPLAAQLAQQLGVPLLSNSDSHRAGLMGQFCNELIRPAATPGELFAMLRGFQFQAAARPDQSFRMCSYHPCIRRFQQARFFACPPPPDT